MQRLFFLSLFIFTLNLQAKTIYERFQDLEKEVATLKQRLENANGEDDNKTVIIKSDQKELNALKEEIKTLNTKLTKLETKENPSHLVFSVDFQSSLTSLDYELKNGTKRSNDAFFENTFKLNGLYRAHERLLFSSQFSFYNQSDDSLNNSNSTNIADNNEIRVSEAYLRYNGLFGTESSWDLLIGRFHSKDLAIYNPNKKDFLPSDLPHLYNLESDAIAIESNFEGGAFLQFSYNKSNLSQTVFASNSTNVSDISTYTVKYVPHINTYNAVEIYALYADDFIGKSSAGSTTYLNVGDLGGIGANYKFNVDDFLFFVSTAASRTFPNESMLGSTNAQNGLSFWAGLVVPAIFREKGSIGFEFNQGSKYWRSFTYAEDSFYGSKVATRGAAYEVYFNEPFVDDKLIFQVSLLHIDYGYSGSNALGGAEGSPANSLSTEVSSITNFKASLKYSF